MSAGLLYDSTECIGCQACAEACKAENQLPPTIEPTTTAYTWTTVTERKGGWLRSLCMHCLEPTCVSVCPVGALPRRRRGRSCTTRQVHGLPLLHDGVPVRRARSTSGPRRPRGAQVRHVPGARREGRADRVRGRVPDRRDDVRRARGAARRGTRADSRQPRQLRGPRLWSGRGRRHVGTDAVGLPFEELGLATQPAAPAAADALTWRCSRRCRTSCRSPGGPPAASSGSRGGAKRSRRSAPRPREHVDEARGAAAARFGFWAWVACCCCRCWPSSPCCASRTGSAPATNLSDRFPWGLWIGFDVLCGVGLAAGGFTLTSVVHIFNLRSSSRSCGRRC